MRNALQKRHRERRERIIAAVGGVARVMRAKLYNKRLSAQGEALFFAEQNRNVNTHGELSAKPTEE